MAVITLRAPLKDRAGGIARHDLPGATVGAALSELETRYPTVKGWILDERGRVRSHVGVFVNGERAVADTQVGPADVVHVLPSISGGSETGWVIR
ncbi:MAG TPA: MoaD/ThiS family protein [Actinomycetota bacterium]|nr:MoaD/ThiS family protein [Actinomycetota bacterium]